LTTIVPATACHCGSCAERYSRFKTWNVLLQRGVKRKFLDLEIFSYTWQYM
jgi:hypothetical protein